MSTLQALGKLFPLGDRNYFAKVSQFNGELYIHIRKCFEKRADGDEPPVRVPTKYGVALNQKEFIQLQTLIPVLQDIVEQNLGKLEDSKKNCDASVKIVKINEAKKQKLHKSA